MRQRLHAARSNGRQGRWLPSLVAGLAFALASTLRAQAPEPAPPPAADQGGASATTPARSGAKIWLGQETRFEELLRRAKVTRIERIPIGVTHPKVAFVEPGLPFSRVAWKPLKPGRLRGFYESYRSEIAAYELDKLIGLGMVPPAVERRLEGELGAAILWIENVRGWNVKQELRGPDPAVWERQLVRMKMFDNLSGNIDRNQGNLLYDEEYQIILIDHSRALTDVVDMSRFPRLPFVDRELWERIQGLTLETAQPALGQWMSKDSLRAMLERRDRMKAEIDALVGARGPSAWLR